MLSNGPARSISLLHLIYDLSIDDLKQFRQLHSRTPGHPEFRLRQALKPPLARWVGLANAVGFALAEKSPGRAVPSSQPTSSTTTLRVPGDEAA